MIDQESLGDEWRPLTSAPRLHSEAVGGLIDVYCAFKCSRCCSNEERVGQGQKCRQETKHESLQGAAILATGHFKHTEMNTVPPPHMLTLTAVKVSEVRAFISQLSGNVSALRFVRLWV